MEKYRTYKYTEEVAGPISGVGAGGGAVALMVGIDDVGINVPESVYRYRHIRVTAVLREYQVWRYRQALRALRQVMVQSGGDRSELDPHSLGIGAATNLTAGGE